MLSFLGPYSFVGVTGTPGLPVAQILAESRAGVNGHTLWRLGVWGKPCLIETIQPALNYYAAIDLWVTYPVATQMNPLPFWIGGKPIPGGRYQVMDVQGSAEPRVRFNLAWDATHYQAVVRAVWQLLPIANVT
jgi:hypothetical protein